MIPILFEYDTLIFQDQTQGKLNHGIGDLVDCKECTAKITDEGEFELSLKYPMTGALFNELKINRIILAKVPYSRRASPYQAFRIYGYEKGIDGMITVNCQHVSYDMADIPVKSFDKVNHARSSMVINQSLLAMKAVIDNAVLPAGYNCPFRYSGTDVNDNSNITLKSYVSGYPHTEDSLFKVTEPKSMRAIILDGDDSIRGCWGGDVVYDNFVVALYNYAGNESSVNYQTAGYDNGVTLEYGIDITDLSLEEELSELSTGVLPYWKGEIPAPGSAADDHETVEKIVYGNIKYVTDYDSTLIYQRHKIIPLDLSDFFQEDIYLPTDSAKEETLIWNLDTKAIEWMRAEEMGQPEFNVTISRSTIPGDGFTEFTGDKFIPGINYYTRTGQVFPYAYSKTTDQTKQENKTYYIYSGNIKDICLYDAIRILFPKMGIAVKAKVSSYTYNVLQEICTDIEVTHGTHQSRWRGLEDASRLKRGLIPPSRIGNRSIQQKQIATGAVGGRTIANGGVTAGKIGKDAVDTPNVKDGAVKEEKVDTGAITVNKIRDGAVKTAKIDDNAVNGDKILQYAVSLAKLESGLQVTWLDIVAAKDVVTQTLKADNIYGGYKIQVMNVDATYVHSTSGTFSQLTIGGNDTRWSYVECGDGIKRWLLTRD